MTKWNDTGSYCWFSQNVKYTPMSNKTNVRRCVQATKSGGKVAALTVDNNMAEPSEQQETMPLPKDIACFCQLVVTRLDVGSHPQIVCLVLGGYLHEARSFDFFVDRSLCNGDFRGHSTSAIDRLCSEVKSL